MDEKLASDYDYASGDYKTVQEGSSGTYVEMDSYSSYEPDSYSSYSSYYDRDYDRESRRKE